MKFARKKNFFTLIELLIVIAIIGIIVSISFVSLSNVRQKGRDTQRISDIKLIQKSLEDYYRQEGSYPNSLVPGGSLVGSSSNAVYIQIIPSNPTPQNDGNCPSSDYVYRLYDGGYLISFCLSESSAQISAGEKCATPQGIESGACFFCGEDQVDYEGQEYNTVIIGDQCWFAENLNIGTAIAGDTDQSNNSIVEKYCYDNNESNCTTYGGLYQWNEAMQYSTTNGAQGICPSGWHIPTDVEQNTLDQALNDTTCDAYRMGGHDCANAGTKLKTGGTSDFNGLMAGLRNIDGFNNFFMFIDTDAHFWSSTISDSSAWFRYLFIDYATVGRTYYHQNHGFSVRCLKN